MDIIHYAPYLGWVYPNETVIEWSDRKSVV